MAINSRIFDRRKSHPKMLVHMAGHFAIRPLGALGGIEAIFWAHGEERVSGPSVRFALRMPACSGRAC